MPFDPSCPLTRTLMQLYIIMHSVNFFCNISSYDILAYITKNYIALICYAKIVHLLFSLVAKDHIYRLEM
jgi:hypothetical protein